MCELLGEPPESLVGTMIAEWCTQGIGTSAAPNASGCFDGEFDRYRAERRYLRRDGGTIWCLMTVSLIRDDGGCPQYLFSQFQDISERKANEEVLEHGVHHDALTGLPNRRRLFRRLEESLARIPSEGKLAVLLLDVDRFKVVNDGLGHAAGDRILVEIARRLAGGVRSMDTVARFGGDEFIVVCEQVRGLEEAEALARRALALFDEPFDVHGKPLAITASCGIVLVDDGATAEDALRDADAAMYLAKEQGRGRPQVFESTSPPPGRAEPARHRAGATARSRPRRALAALSAGRRGRDRTDRRRGSAGAVGAPRTGDHVAGRVHPGGGGVGLIVPIGDHVLVEAVAQVADWRRSPPECRELRLAVNRSQRQFAFGDPLASCDLDLAAAGAPPDLLRVELTETTVMNDVDAAIRVLGAFRHLGVASPSTTSGPATAPSRTSGAFR